MAIFGINSCHCSWKLVTNQLQIEPHRRLPTTRPWEQIALVCYIFTFNRDFRFTALPFTVYPAGCLIVIKTMAEGPFNSNVRSVRSSAYNDFPAPFRNGFDFHGEWHPQGHRALAVLLLTLSHCSLLYAVQRVWSEICPRVVREDQERISRGEVIKVLIWFPFQCCNSSGSADSGISQLVSWSLVFERCPGYVLNIQILVGRPTPYSDVRSWHGHPSPDWHVFRLAGREPWTTLVRSSQRLASFDSDEHSVALFLSRISASSSIPIPTIHSEIIPSSCHGWDSLGRWILVFSRERSKLNKSYVYCYVINMMLVWLSSWAISSLLIYFKYVRNIKSCPREDSNFRLLGANDHNEMI